MPNTTDLFENPQLLPPNVLAIIDTYNESEQDYDTCAWLLIQLHSLGYTFEYGLDAVPYNLRKL